MKVHYLNMLNGSHWWHRVQLFLCNRKLKSSVCKTFSVSDNNGMNRLLRQILSMLQICMDHAHISIASLVMHISLRYN